ncbi:hypothetical protein ACFSUS_10700 [Spirosoma soli]|uniref:Uncharacterized protein n=1 Tax=Spirosoma soli TaxID=1770529 RepID=A0ABW5M2A3_9BACT
MKCTCHILSNSVSGRIVLYGDAAPDDTHNIILHFNNITQWLCYDDFLALEWNVRAIDIAAYFDNNPYEERIHLSTPSRYLNFSFRPDELIELRKMLSGAAARLHWLEMLKKAQN